MKIGSTYYWFGEYKDNNHTMRAYMGHVTAPFVAHTCYSSTDFVHWTFVNNVLTQQASGDLGPDRVVERPKVIYNDTTGQYVMYMHIDNNRYSDARVGVAYCSTVGGNYTYLGGFKPLGYDSKDMTLFKDDDGSAYLISGRCSECLSPLRRLSQRRLPGDINLSFRRFGVTGHSEVQRAVLLFCLT